MSKIIKYYKKELNRVGFIEETGQSTLRLMKEVRAEALEEVEKILKENIENIKVRLKADYGVKLYPWFEEDLKSQISQLKDSNKPVIQNDITNKPTKRQEKKHD